MSKPKIVVIDDEVDFVNMLKEYFSLRGYEINVALAAAEGIELVRTMKPDLVLMDLKMPGMGGEEALARIKALEPTLKVIFVTGYDDNGKTRSRLIDKGAHAYFDKPIASLRELEECIHTAIAG